ncbi:unnamed protein product [Hymenolepis diminuta]|uniref:Uncharacterized protein n=1 Tax=Hymenolepis diminuta TaxID=6216 RepID=A0A564Y121_HYMDI|nr:unnamed protein product [Hymenolepis diminuta]
MRITTLPRKFSKSGHDLNPSYFLPLSPKDLTFKESIEKCEKAFGHNTSLFNRRIKCLNLAKCEGEDIHNYSAILNRMRYAS